VGLAPLAVLGQREGSRLGVELLGDLDTRARQIDTSAAQGVELARTQAAERRHLQPGRERRADKPASVTDQRPYLLLARWLLVAAAGSS
jgi:hypothetical protein